MATHLSNNVVPIFNAHRHNWQPIGGWRARYRCRECGAVGYKPRLVTMDVEGGPYGSTRITPCVCAVTRAGLRCGCPAVSKTRGAWKCRAHLSNSPANTHGARALLLAANSNDPPRNPVREDEHQRPAETTDAGA
jgi:hypothetical protein